MPVYSMPKEILHQLPTPVPLAQSVNIRHPVLLYVNGKKMCRGKLMGAVAFQRVVKLLIIESILYYYKGYTILLY